MRTYTEAYNAMGWLIARVALEVWPEQDEIEEFREFLESLWQRHIEQGPEARSKVSRLLAALDQDEAELNNMMHLGEILDGLVDEAMGNGFS